MEIEIKQTKREEAEQIIEIQNTAFYDDYVRYGLCPGYGRSVQEMRMRIQQGGRYTIYADDTAVGTISVAREKQGVYHIGCLCVLPEYQRRGIGSKAVQFVKDTYDEWEKITLDTPADKKDNVEFYTQKCGFKIVSKTMAENVELYLFELSKGGMT